MNIQDILDGKSQEQINEKMNKFFYEKDWYPDEGSVTGPFVPGQAYQPINGLPAGGEAGQCLVKSSDKDYETVWKDFPDLPAYLKEITLERMEDWDNKQAALIPGVNLKTVNNKSLLGAGNIEIIGGDTVPIGAEFEYNGEEVPEGYERVPNLIDIVYPVGSIFVSVNNTSPEILFGGKWEQIKDKFLLSAGDTYEAGSTGGEAEHTLTTEEIPSHQHNLWRLPLVDTYGGGVNVSGYTLPSLSAKTAQKIISEPTGGSNAHNNMPPYITVYMWWRIG